MRCHGARSRWGWLLVGLACLLSDVSAAQTPVGGHYPPGQSGLRGAATPGPGLSFTNFNRFFSNLSVKDGTGTTTEDLNETRYANVSMFAWTTGVRILGLSYGALIGIPFTTGNLNPSSDDRSTTTLGLGDILVTPVSLYSKSTAFDFQVQFTVWSASGRFVAGGADNRGAGFWSLVYSAGGAFYPGGNRRAWSLSAIARFEQNFEQEGTGITPGDDIVVDASLGRMVPLGKRSLDIGLSGFAVRQLTNQTGGPASAQSVRYRYFGLGPEAAVDVTTRLGFVVRVQWEFWTRNAIQGNNLWLILKYRLQ